MRFETPLLPAVPIGGQKIEISSGDSPNSVSYKVTPVGVHLNKRDAIFVIFVKFDRLRVVFAV